jgi:hypothetical protein
MSSGGGTKVDNYDYILIEADSERQGRDIFEERFDRDPENVTCSCCGSDYSIQGYDTLEEASAYDRHCEYIREGADKGYDLSTAKVTIEDYEAREDVLIIRKEQS